MGMDRVAHLMGSITVIHRAIMVCILRRFGRICHPCVCVCVAVRRRRRGKEKREGEVRRRRRKQICFGTNVQGGGWVGGWISLSLWSLRGRWRGGRGRLRGRGPPWRGEESGRRHLRRSTWRSSYLSHPQPQRTNGPFLKQGEREREREIKKGAWEYGSMGVWESGSV